ncbi:hypothetical protein F2Q68_00030350 [Brassica cretica]|uniref:Membrane protein of ER body-like protein n=1 Tax=Brassica cretica TaxID=69181 RepID=A0A8S9G621_BRACR|nr:hypothetical protein F2Q68_00030350 [Brassica cretica]
MGSAAKVNEPTTAGTEKLHHPVNLEEEEEEQVVELERKTSSFPHGKRPDSADGSTITTSNSSSSSFSEGIPDPRNGEGEHIAIENLEVPESPVVGFHEEHHDGNVFFDGEEGIWKCRHCDWSYREESLLCFETKGSESADAEPDAHESHTADNLSAEKRERASENGSTSGDNNKGPSGEIEEVQDTDLPKEVVAVVVQRTADVIEEEEERVRGPDPIDPILRSEDNEPSPGGGDSSTPESFFYKCLSCFSIFIPKGMDSKPVAPSETVERLNTQPKPQEEATAHSNWFGSMFGSKKKEPPVQQGGAMPSIPEASLPRDNPSVLGEETAGSTANIPSKAPALIQEGPVPSIQDVSEISVSLDNKPVDDTPLIQVANSNDTGKGVNSGATLENGQQFLVPSADEEQTQQKIDRDGASSAADENHSPDKGRLSPIQPSRDMNISNIVTSGPDGVRVETIFHTEGVSHLFEGTEPRKPDFGLAKVTGVMESGDGAPIRGIDIPPLPLSSLEEGTLTEPLVRPAVAGPVVEGRKVEILKSIVYGGLIEAITSLGVISSAAGSGASTLNILVLGLANLFGGLILIIHNLQELREEEPITTEDNQTNVQEEGRYKRLLGRRENFTLHVTVAIISFIIMGLLPPIVYYFSFSKTHNRDYKVASVFGASLLCIVLLALAKVHVRSPRGSHLKSVLKYAMIAVSVSGISYVVGNFVDQLLEKYGWSDGSETPAAEMMLSLLGRKAGSFGYSSSY